ncbi:hypothetical protein GQ457_08G025310 [Hibiscus cannabinus]
MSRQTCHKEGWRIVKVKDLKPKRIKDYLEYKFNQRILPSRDIVYDQVKQLIGLRHKPITLQDALPRSDSQPKFSAKAGLVVSVRDIPFVILLKQNIGAPFIREVEALTVDPEATID